MDPKVAQLKENMIYKIRLRFITNFHHHDYENNPILSPMNRRKCIIRYKVPKDKCVLY